MWDLQQLAKTPDELQALHQFKAEHPDVNSEDDLSMALEAYRAAKLRKRALAIRFRHRYPNATAEEVNILVDDQVAREGPYPAAAPMDCIEYRRGLLDNHELQLTGEKPNCVTERF